MESMRAFINENEQIFLDGKELVGVTAYKLENSADSKEPAKLTVTLYVNAIPGSSAQ